MTPATFGDHYVSQLQSSGVTIEVHNERKPREEKESFKRKCFTSMVVRWRPPKCAIIGGNWIALCSLYSYIDASLNIGPEKSKNRSIHLQFDSL
jgi:hypothetical protein